MRSRSGFAIVLALPGLLLAGSGFFHPHHLTYDTSQQWFWLHVPGLVGFPLIGVALILLVRGRNDLLAWLIRLAAYTYMTFYSALDVINGLAAGYLTHQDGGKYRATAVPELFDLGRPLGNIGAWAIVLTAFAVVVDQVLRHRALALPAIVLLPGAWFVRTDHIFSPIGVLGMALLGLGTGYLAWIDDTAHPEKIRTGSSATFQGASAS